MGRWDVAPIANLPPRAGSGQALGMGSMGTTSGAPNEAGYGCLSCALSGAVKVASWGVVIFEPT
jgi:hypothetical protein